MRKTMHVMGILFLVGMMIMNAGCASYMSYQSSKNEISRDRVMAVGDTSAIRQMNAGAPPTQVLKAINLGGNGVGLAMSLEPKTMEILSKHGVRQFGAAILDVGAVWLAKEGIQYLNESGDDDPIANEAGRDIMNVNVNDSSGVDISIGNTSGLDTLE